MAFTVRIPQSYATRIINAIQAGPAKDLPSTRLNVQPDGSLLVRSESAKTPYEAYVDIFNQNLGIPIAAIRGFETFADTAADANRYRTDVATTSEKKAAIDASGLGAPSRAIAPEDITTPSTGSGDFQDLTFDERRAIGEMPFGPYQITPAQLLSPSFYRDQQAAAQLDEGIGEQTSVAGLFSSTPVLQAGTDGIKKDEDDVVDMPMLRGDGDKGDGDAGKEPADMPANLPPFWRERYDEYLLLSPELQNVILQNQVKNYIDLEPYRGEGINGGASIQGLFDFIPGSVAGDALSRAYDPTKGGVGGQNFEVQPPAGYVPPVTGTMASPAGMPTFSSQDLINDPQGYLTAAGQRLAFRNVFGEPAATGVGPLASYLQRQTFPLTQAFRASSFANIGREQAGEAAPQSSFEEFLRSVQSQPTGLGGAYGQALQDVGYLRGLESSQVPTALAGVFNPEQAAGTRDARALLEAAQRGKYSNLVSSSFRRPSEDELFADYVLARQDAATAGAAPQNFLNFAASRYGL